MARRRYGSGAAKQRSDGRWEGRIRLSDGSRRYVYARSRDQLAARLQEERWRLACGIPVRARGLSLADLPAAVARCGSHPAAPEDARRI